MSKNKDGLEKGKAVDEESYRQVINKQREAERHGRKQPAKPVRAEKEVRSTTIDGD